MDIHAPHIDRHDADDDRRRQPPVKQAQGQVPDNQAITCFGPSVSGVMPSLPVLAPGRESPGCSGNR